MLRCPRPRTRRLQSPRSAPLHFVQQTRSAQRNKPSSALRNQKENPHNKCRDQLTNNQSQIWLFCWLLHWSLWSFWWEWHHWIKLMAKMMHHFWMFMCHFDHHTQMVLANFFNKSIVNDAWCCKFHNQERNQSCAQNITDKFADFASLITTRLSSAATLVATTFFTFICHKKITKTALNKRFFFKCQIKFEFIN